LLEQNSSNQVIVEEEQNMEFEAGGEDDFVKKYFPFFLKKNVFFS
jgi:hypothetical protein